MESGHIPGSKTLPWKSLMTSDKTGYQELRPVNELQDIFKEKGIDMTKPLTASCGSGGSSIYHAIAKCSLFNSINTTSNYTCADIWPTFCLL